MKSQFYAAFDFRHLIHDPRLQSFLSTCGKLFASKPTLINENRVRYDLNGDR